MNPCDTIQAGYLMELDRLKKENAELKKERRELTDKLTKGAQTMTDIPELRRWSAELVGWKQGPSCLEHATGRKDWSNFYYLANPKSQAEEYIPKALVTFEPGYNISVWTPDLDSAPTWQIKAVIKAMRNLGWLIEIENTGDDELNYKWSCRFENASNPYDFYYATSDDFQTAILQAAHEAWKARKGDDNAG